MKSVRIKLTKGLSARVDALDFERISKHKWYATVAGYAARSLNGGCVYMHRAILYCPKGLEIDHVNGDKLDNRRRNLRICTHAQNGKNMKLSKANKTGFKGVDKHSQNGNYRAQIMVDGKLKHLGCFDTAEKAGAAYDKACKKFHGQFANPSNK